MEGAVGCLPQWLEYVDREGDTEGHVVFSPKRNGLLALYSVKFMGSRCVILVA